MDSPGSPPDRHDRHDRPTVVIDGYELLATIGHGGFSVVYRARQRSMNRDVAIKVLNTGFADDAERRLFVRECHALGQLSHHPNIVTVFSDAMTSDGRPAIVMELYRSNYRDLIDRGGPLPVGAVLAMTTRVCGALQTAHDAGVLHRDIKPHNIFVSAYDEPALGDFGISTVDEERSQSGFSAMSVAYAAPEILDEAGASVSSDLYALGASLYQLLTGDAPFRSNELSATLRRIVTEPPPAVERPDVPDALNALIADLLAKDPAARPASALDVAERVRDLQRGLGVEPTPVPRMRPDPDALSLPPVPSSTPSSSSPSSSPLPPPPAPGAPPLGQTSSPTVPPRAAVDPTIACERPSPVTDADAPEGWRRRRSRWGWAIAAAAAVLVLVVGGVVVLSGDDDEAGSSGGDEQGQAVDDASGRGEEAADAGAHGDEGGSGDAEDEPAATLPPPEVLPSGLMPPDYDFRVEFEMPDDAATMVIRARPADGESEDVEPKVERVKKSPETVSFTGVRNICVTLRALDADGNEIGRTADETCGGFD